MSFEDIERETAVASKTGRSSRADLGAYAEQHLFVLSPFNLWITGALLYAVLIGAYGLAAADGGVSWLVTTAKGPALADSARVALILALILVAVLVVQRYARLKDIEDAPAVTRGLIAGAVWRPYWQDTRRLRLWGAFGMAAGAAWTLFLLARPGVPWAVVAWFTVIDALLGGAFFRGLQLTRTGAGYVRSVIDKEMRIDLLRIDRLYPWGRSAARTALVWFTVSATCCLFFVGGGLTIAAIVAPIGAMLLGFWVFVGVLMAIHKKIRGAKAEELDHLRDEIDLARSGLMSDPSASSKLQGLLAYEARIDSAREWPFDQTILMRVGASALILTIPWFGAAIASLVVEHLLKPFVR